MARRWVEIVRDGSGGYVVFLLSGIESLSLTMQPIVIENSNHAKASIIPNAAVSAEENATAEALTKPSQCGKSGGG